LIKYSKEELSLVIKNAKHVKIDGIYIASEFTESLLWTKRNGKIRGTTTHIASLDKGWTWRKQENNLWSGYANEGKSQFLYYLSILKAKFDNWKFAIFSPENMPIEDLFDDLIQMFVNKTCDAHYANVMSDEEYIEAINFISNHFFIIAPPNDSKLDSIFSLLNFVVSKNSIDAVIIDPYNQIEHIIGKGERDDLYVGRFMSSLKKFAVDKNISMNLVAHQNTPDIAGEKEYPKPNMYRVKGGGTFADKVDNLILVWRPYKRTNFKDPTVMILVQKIKKQRLVGIPQEITLHYIIDKYMYVDPNNYDFKMNMLKQANNTNDENNVFDTSYNVNDITMTF
jgi:twinkle protein